MAQKKLEIKKTHSREIKPKNFLFQIVERDKPSANHQLQAQGETVPKAAGRAMGRRHAHVTPHQLNEKTQRPQAPPPAVQVISALWRKKA